MMAIQHSRFLCWICIPVGILTFGIALKSHSLALKGICLNLYGRSHPCIFPMMNEHGVMKITIFFIGSSYTGKILYCKLSPWGSMHSTLIWMWSECYERLKLSLLMEMFLTMFTLIKSQSWTAPWQCLELSFFCAEDDS